MISAYMSGLAVGSGLIIAIGAQNAFVLVKAIRREHHLLVAGICAFLDALLIGTGVLGVGALVASNPVLRIGAGAGGALFLGWFGVKALRAVFSTQALDVSGSTGTKSSLRQTVLAALAVSLLNPHVYLDTVVMLGSISANFPGTGRYFFGTGAATGSVLWFFGLAVCGSLLAPVFAKPRSWQVLNGIVCITVWLVAFQLGLDVWRELFPAA